MENKTLKPPIIVKPKDCSKLAKDDFFDGAFKKKSVGKSGSKTGWLEPLNLSSFPTTF